MANFRLSDLSVLIHLDEHGVAAARLPQRAVRSSPLADATGLRLLSDDRRLLGRQSYASDERRRLDKRGHLQALVVEVYGKIKRTVSDVPSRDQAIFDP